MCYEYKGYAIVLSDSCWYACKNGRIYFSAVSDTELESIIDSLQLSKGIQGKTLL